MLIDNGKKSTLALTIEELEKFNIFKEKIISLELLKTQGFNNISYLVKTVTNKYILKVFKSNESVNINRDFEYETLKKINRLNITSKPIFINETFMIYEFIKGFHKTKLSSSEIKKLTLLIKKYHKIKPKIKYYDFRKDLKNYDSFLNDFKSNKLLNETSRTLNFIKKYKKENVLTHHDLNSKNIIFNNKEIKIIDWEYVGINDIYFDLASLCVEFGLNTKQQKQVLFYYFSVFKHDKNKKLKNFITLYKNLCELWFLKFTKI